MKNNTTKSIILAPFNSTKSHISDDFHKKDDIQELLVSNSVIQFANKCREANRQFMLNNNAELDNGVYNEQEEKEKLQQQDDLKGLDEQIELSQDLQQNL